MNRAITTVWAIGIMMLVGCDSEPKPVDHSREVLLAARAEAGKITAVDGRLRHLLNVAHAQNWNAQRADRRETLSQARQTLQAAKPGELQPRILLAGWISIAELSWCGCEDRTATEDIAMANDARDQAIAHLRAMPSPAERTSFVRGVAERIRRQRTMVEADKFLVEGAQWATQIQEVRLRRRAFRAYANDLYQSEDVADAQAVLDNDSDPAWRSSALVALTTSSYSRVPFLRRLHRYSPYAAANGLRDESARDPSDATQPDGKDDDKFGEPLDYESNFGDEN